MFRFLCKKLLVQNGRITIDLTNKNKLCSSFSLQTPQFLKTTERPDSVLEFLGTTHGFTKTHTRKLFNKVDPLLVLTKTISSSDRGVLPRSSFIPHVLPLPLPLKSNGYCTAISNSSSSSSSASANNKNMGENKMTTKEANDDCKELQMIKNGGDGIVLDDIVSYNELIDLYFKQGKLNAAVLLFQEMEEKGLERDQYTTEILVNGLCENGLVYEAWFVYEDTKMKGLPINSVACNCLLDGFFKVGNLDYAIGLFLEMDEVKDSFSYDILVHGFCNNDMLIYAPKVIMRCLEDGIKILPSTQQVVFEALRDSGFIREEEELKLAIQEARKERA